MQKSNSPLAWSPTCFGAYANHPPLLEANWLKVKKMMMEGSLSRKAKETIAVLVPCAVSCTNEFCCQGAPTQNLA